MRSLSASRNWTALYHTDVVNAFINQTIERKEDDVKRVADLFTKIIDNEIISQSVFNASFAEFMEMVDDISIDVPQAYKYTAQLMVGAKIDLATLAPMLKPLIDLSPITSPAADMVVEFLKALRAKEGEAVLEKQVQAARMDFRALFPEKKQSDKELIGYLNMHDMFVLMPELKVARHIETRLGKDTAEAILDWCDTEVSAEVRASDDFVRAVAGSVLRHIVNQTIMAGNPRQPHAITPELEEKERELLKTFAPLLSKAISGRSAASRAHVLFAAQSIAAGLNFPEGLLQRMFSNLMEEGIVSRDALQAWKKDDKYEQSSKQEANKQIESWYASL
jgi:hypothetical protein